MDISPLPGGFAIIVVYLSVYWVVNSVIQKVMNEFSSNFQRESIYAYNDFEGECFYLHKFSDQLNWKALKLI